MPTIQTVYYSLAKTRLRVPLTWYRHLQIHQNDVLLASYPRSGNTWLRFLLYELLTGVQADFETINRADSAVPEIGKVRNAPALLPGNGRIIKTHEPFRKEYKRAIYLVRDPRDVAISEFYFLKGKGINYRSFNLFLTDFLNGKANGYGCWKQHVQSWFNAKQENKAQILVAKYEELQANPKDTLSQITEFLGITADPDRIQTIIQHNAIQKMKNKENKARNTAFKQYTEGVNFIRQGRVRGWEKTLNPEQVHRIESKTQAILDQLGYIHS